MSQKSIEEIAESFGLSIEDTAIPDHEHVFRVIKGAKQVFLGHEEAVRDFFIDYEKNRPGLYEGSIYGYTE